MAPLVGYDSSDEEDDVQQPENAMLTQVCVCVCVRLC